MKKIRISTAIGFTVLLLALAVSTLAWPFGKIKYTANSGRHSKMTEVSGNIDTVLRAQQTFIPEYRELQAVHIYVSGELAEDTQAVLSVTFFDKDLQVVSMQELPLAGKTYPGYVRVPTESVSFHAGERYYYLIGAMKEPVTLAYTADGGTKTVEGLETYYAETLQEGSSLLAFYEYKAPFHWQQALILALLCLAGSAVLTAVLDIICRCFYIHIQVPAALLLRSIGTVLTAAVSLTAFIAVGPMQMFTKSIVNIVFYEIGIILFALTCLYLLYGKSGGKAEDDRTESRAFSLRSLCPSDIAAKVEHAACYLQKAAFAGAILACCHYGNALYTAGQESASVWIFGCFAAAIICCVGMGICRIVMNREAHRKTGIRFSVTYALLLLFLFLLLIVYRNERAWVWKVIVPFTLFYLAFIFAGRSRKIMKNLIDGIIISFVLLTGYCLIHRPYHYYRYNRYPMYFHTVTVTGMYLILVISAAFAKFLAAWNKEELQRKLLLRKSLILHTLMLGITLSYLLMAVSRIGMVTMLVIFAAVLLMTAVCGQDYVRPVGKRILAVCADSAKRLAIIAAGVLWCFPICFTATRILPAAVMQPERTELEEWPPYTITADTPMDSDLYMTFPKFLNLMLNRVSTSADEITFADLFGGKEEEASLSANTVTADAADKEANLMTEGQTAASTGTDTAEETPPEEDKKDYSNGRRDVWKLYLDNLNVDGHATMQADKEIAHAHNTYLQSAYDHGILFGIVFLVFCILSGCKSVHYYIVRRKKDEYAAFPLIIMLAFGITSMVEWVFHPCIPLGFTFLAVIAPLIGQPLRRGGYL